MTTGKTWFTADHHFNHKNIIKYCDRPFENVIEMNEEMITRWNAKVKAGDTVYYLGDFMMMPRRPLPYARQVTIMRKILDQLKFRRLYWIPGNHDPNDDVLISIPKVRVLPRLHIFRFDHYPFTVCHWPMASWPGSRRGYHLHGHVHGKNGQDLARRRFDVGVDSWDFYPVSIEQLREKVKRHKLYVATKTVVPPLGEQDA
jgi:calcineurin-like phosphoesterase family protein